MLVRALLRAVLLIIVASTVIAPALHANGPAWNRTKDGYYLRFGISWLTASDEYGLDGKRHSLFDDSLGFQDAKFGQTDVSLLCEYGITDWLTAVAQTQLRTVVREAYDKPTGRDTTISASGLTDLWLGTRFRLLPTESPHHVSVTLAWKAPMGSPTQEIPLGTGVADYSLGAAGATPYELAGIKGQVQLSSDFRLRNKASNEIAFAGQLEVDLGRGFIMQGTLDGVRSLADFDAAATSGARVNRTSVGDRTFTRWSLGLVLEADEGLDLGASFTDYFVGRNALASTAISISVTWRKP